MEFEMLKVKVPMACLGNQGFCWTPNHVWLATRQLHSIVYIYTPRQPAF